MAFRNLVEEDCGNSSSLLNFALHYAKDHGLKEEGINQPFHALPAHRDLNADQLVQDFLEESACPQTFRMDNLLHEMREININSPTIAPRVVTELTNLSTEWQNDYFESNKQLEMKTQHDISDRNELTMQSFPVQNEDTHLEIQEFNSDSKWAKDYVEDSINITQNDSKNNDTELVKFETHIEVPINNCVTPHFGMLPIRQHLMEQYFDCQEKTYFSEFRDNDTFLNGVEEELEAAGAWPDIIMDKNSLPESTLEIQDLLQKEKHINDHRSRQEYYKKYFDDDDSIWKYRFKQSNPMKNLPNALEEGKERLKKGDLPGAILCFEAVVQQEEEHSEAWFLLGKAQAENEQDYLAIGALRRCISLDPTNGAALMALAVSYTNESNQTHACRVLRKWIKENKKYKHLLGPPSHLDEREKLLFEDWTTPSFLHPTNMAYDHIKEVYLKAAQMNPQGEIDPDVQCGLGVLLTLKNDYEKAADCFEAALRMRPEDSGLWNRWGATLANGHRSGEAVMAYRRALELSPGFIRARYNLGISCINLGAHEQAVEHLLIALNQQAAGRKIYDFVTPRTVTSNTIWSTLRLVLTIMNKRHLMEFVDKRDLDKLNEEFGVV